jgi:hypothetical protein
MVCCYSPAAKYIRTYFRLITVISVGFPTALGAIDFRVHAPGSQMTVSRYRFVSCATRQRVHSKAVELHFATEFVIHLDRPRYPIRRGEQPLGRVRVRHPSGLMPIREPVYRPSSRDNRRRTATASSDTIISHAILRRRSFSSCLAARGGLVYARRRRQPSAGFGARFSRIHILRRLRDAVTHAQNPLLAGATSQMLARWRRS